MAIKYNRLFTLLKKKGMTMYTLRKNKVIEARILYFVLSFIGGYLLSEFFLGFWVI